MPINPLKRGLLKRKVQERKIGSGKLLYLEFGMVISHNIKLDYRSTNGRTYCICHYWLSARHPRIYRGLHLCFNQPLQRQLHPPHFITQTTLTITPYPRKRPRTLNPKIRSSFSSPIRPHVPLRMPPSTQHFPRQLPSHRRIQTSPSAYLCSIVSKRCQWTNMQFKGAAEQPDYPNLK